MIPHAQVIAPPAEHPDDVNIHDALAEIRVARQSLDDSAIQRRLSRAETSLERELVARRQRRGGVG